MELEPFNRQRIRHVGRGLWHHCCPSYNHVCGVGSPADDFVEKRRHQHPTRSSTLSAGVDGHSQELAAAPYPGSGGRSVSQGLQYPAPIPDHPAGGAGAALRPSCQRKLLYRLDTSVEPAMNPAGWPSHSAMIRNEHGEMQILWYRRFKKWGPSTERNPPDI